MSIRDNLTAVELERLDAICKDMAAAYKLTFEQASERMERLSRDLEAAPIRIREILSDLNSVTPLGNTETEG